MGVSRKQSTPNFPKNEHFLPPDTHTYVCVSGVNKCLFFGKLGVLCFLEIPVLRFALLPITHEILEMLQCSSSLASLGVIRGTSREKTYQELGLESLAKTLVYEALLF